MLRALILASSFWVFSLPLTVAAGSVAAALGAVLAVYGVSRTLQRPPFAGLRSGIILAAAVAIAVGGLLAGRLLSASAGLAGLLGPIHLFQLAETVTWFAIGFGLSIGLRGLASRHSTAGLLEILWVAAAFVMALAAHRNGMIHRPFFIGDFALMRGLDPSHILMGAGCAAVLGLSALLLGETSRRRLPYHFAVLALLCLPLLVYIRLFSLPAPRLTEELNLTGAERGGGPGQEQNPFIDGNNESESRQTPVAVVVFRDDYEPLSGTYYFRESAYSRFNGVRLDFAGREDMDQDLIKDYPQARLDAAAGTEARTEADAKVESEASSDTHPVRTTVGMLIPHRNPFGLSDPVAMQAVPNPNTLRFKRTYDVYSEAPHYDFNHLLGRRAGDPRWPTAVQEEYLKLPGDPRYRRLAEELTADLRPAYAEDPFAKVWSIKNYLDENGIYSLENVHAAAADPAASFLFGDLTGYCTHFAFAAVYLYRSLGIPARVAIGYSVPARERAGGSALLVRAVHAHAWPEIYFEGVGWAIVDPAPQRSLVDMSTAPMDSLQQLLGDMLRGDASFAEFLESQRGGAGFAAYWRALQQGLAAALLLALLLSYGVKWYRQWLARGGAAWGEANRAGAYLYAYRGVLDYLAGFGLRRQYGESREGFARRVAALSPSFPTLTDAHLQGALGEQKTLGEQQPELHRHVRQELKRNTRLWQRALSAVNPLSWLWSR